METMTMVLAVSIPVGLGAFVGYLTRDGPRSRWFASLEKPKWSPPNWAFAPVWTALYVLMGIASWRVWASSGGRSHALWLYAAQLALNLAWPLLFFGARSLVWSLADITALLGALFATVAAFHRMDRVAAYLLVPYLAWVTFAMTVNASLYIKNHNQWNSSISL